VVKMTCYDTWGRPYQIDLPGSEPRPEPKVTTQTIVGLDLGQRQDFTALAAVERTRVEGQDATYRVRQLRRWREVAYTDIRDQVAERLRVWGLTTDDTLVLDGTGVGVAVTDLFVEAKRQGAIPAAVSAITITAGFEATRVPGGWHTPKRELIATTTVLLEQRRIEVIGGLPESATLKAELGNFRTKVSAAGHDSYAAWREQDHDDLVLAVALACWSGEHPRVRPWIY